MINPAPVIRKQLYALLNGAVTYNSTPIPVYEGDDSPVLPYKILIGEYSDSPKNNKHVFQGQASQVIEVVAEQPTGVRKNVDAIGESVCNVIHPTPRSILWTTSDLTIVMQGKPSVRHLTEDSGEGGKIVRLILRYNIITSE